LHNISRDFFGSFKDNPYLCGEIYTFTMSREAITQQIAEYFKTQPVLKAWLFGSFARGEETPESDVDILVILDHAKPVGLKFFGMWGDLERMLGRPVDLVVDRTLAPFARQSVENDKILIYERTVGAD
jgi:predicted nucleotidyltransferase